MKQPLLFGVIKPQSRCNNMHNTLLIVR